jgi:arylsulfatase
MIANHRRQRLLHSAGLALIALTACFASLTAQAEDAKPNILFIMGDNIGWIQPSTNQRDLMAGETPKSLGHVCL